MMQQTEKSPDGNPDISMNDLSNPSMQGSTVSIISNNIEPNLCKTRIIGWKNTLILSFGWLFLYGGYLPINSIQNSLNGDKGLGTISLSVQNAFELIGNLFLANVIIFRIGNKWTIVIGAFLFSAFMAANFYPTWATLVPTAALAGLGSSMTWIAQNTYMTKLSQYYADRTGTDFNSVSIRFFGTFYAIYYFSNGLGNMVSSVILGAKFDTPSSNDTVLPYDPMDLCGAKYCNQDLGTYFHPDEIEDPSSSFAAVTGGNYSNFTSPIKSRKPEVVRIYALCGFCLAIILVSTLLMGLVLDSLPALNISEDLSISGSSWNVIVATFRQLTDINLLLLLPLAFYNGLDNDFLNSEFTKAFVTCPLGVEYIGFVSACYGIFGPLSALLCGWLSTKRTRFMPFLVAGLAHLSSAIAMLYWKPGLGAVVYVYVMASAWGVGSGVWASQLNAYFGIVFSNNLEAAFSNYHLWNSVASTLLYASSHSVCTSTKIYILIAILSVGLVGYVIVGYRRHCQNKIMKGR